MKGVAQGVIAGEEVDDSLRMDMICLNDPNDDARSGVDSSVR